MREEVTIPFLGMTIGRFLFLFISIIFMLAVRPFMTETIGVRVLTDILFAVILISGVYAVSQKRNVLIIASLLAISSLLLGGAAYLKESTAFEFISKISFALFVVITLVTILSHILRAKEVTADLVMGAASAYFLFGLVWTFAYYFLEMLAPNSFTLKQGDGDVLGQLLYYSFVTLTTLGYGDITPLTHQARSLAICEAFIGQLYLAVLVARLVGLHIAYASNRDSSSP